MRVLTQGVFGNDKSPLGRSKDDIKAARANVILVRYTVIITLALLFICGALYVSYLLLQDTKINYDTTIATNQANANTYSDTKAQVDELSSKLSNADSILNSEVRYSTILTRIGQLMPAGTVLDSLNLVTGTIGSTPIEVVIYAKSTNEATSVQQSFQSSGGLFSQVTLKSTEDDAGIDGYPVKVTLSLVVNRV